VKTAPSPARSTVVLTTAVRVGVPVASRAASHMSGWATVAVGAPARDEKVTAPLESRVNFAAPGPASGSRMPVRRSAAARFFTTSDCAKPSRVALTTRSTPGRTSAYVASAPSSAGAGNRPVHRMAIRSSPEPTTARSCVPPRCAPESTRPLG
jgi:hypothetical protein